MKLLSHRRCLFFVFCGFLTTAGYAQKSSKQKKQGSANSLGGQPNGQNFGGTGGATDPLSVDPELENFSEVIPEQDSEYLKAGNWSIDLSALQGGSLWKQGSAGFRYFLSATQALSLDFLAGIDKQKEQSSYGISLSSLSYFVQKGRAQPFVFAQLSAGIDKNKKTQNVNDSKDDKLKGGVSAGVGIEVFLLKELSVSARTGVSTQLFPSESLQVATGTGELGLHFLVGAE